MAIKWQKKKGEWQRKRKTVCLPTHFAIIIGILQATAKFSTITIHFKMAILFLPNKVHCLYCHASVSYFFKTTQTHNTIYLYFYLSSLHNLKIALLYSFQSYKLAFLIETKFPLFSNTTTTTTVFRHHQSDHKKKKPNGRPFFSSKAQASEFK